MPNQPIRSLLLVDADAAERRRISAIASRAGWTVIGADGLETAVAILRGPYGPEVRVAVLGNWDPDGTGAIIDALRSCHAQLPVLLLADEEALPLAIEAIRSGATDFLGRPVAPERLLEALASAADRRRPAGELMPIAEKLAHPLSLDQLIGATPEFRSSLAVAAKAARNRLPILIVGEPGTGKETFARAIHSASLRSRSPLVTLDCKSVASNIIDSELFGHEAGAFPGAFSAKSGKMVDADGGTLLLDDVTALTPSTQDALDRTLATGEVRPVGCNGSHSVDVRLIATSSRPLDDSFDPKLRERLEGTVVLLPPLRQRSSDVPALARHLLTRFAEQRLIKPLTIDNEALTVLMRYGWPGNVRQLASVLLRAGLECSSASLSVEDFPHISTQSRFTGRSTDATPNLSQQSSDAAVNGMGAITVFDGDGHIRPLDEIEADLIRLAIGHYRGRMTEVAKRLGIGRSTLYRKLGEIGIDTSAA
ncbi:sigma-54 dependent transcriptional regulator [Sphingomonas sp. RG327]|jgi:DNA-binding NtrC family response regulator|uniref:DNA-binding transcriptional regulator NtrC n=1 Tax=Sphingomonas anseongensis TaxID=2908207 RepID=A0ABT0RDD3_9SPHN|nr:sigma-54 dependent transcriptional regulator [Sphingomonas anseongensis]MCL6678258.1 sigma-54 dependent transcriptional regulator [Sphingomonas anseongensis]